MLRKRKGKSGKHARMSEEERARYMQNRAELELETRRRKQQLIATFAKNKLKREQVFSRLNIAKINEKWRYILRRIKCTELYGNVKHLCETFDRVLKLKDETICSLHRELGIANADHGRLQEAHIMLVDKLIGEHKRNIEALYNVHKLENIKSGNLVRLDEFKGHMMKNIKDIQYSIDKRNEAFRDEQHSIKMRNAINMQNILYLETNAGSDLVHEYFIKIETLWDQLKEIINEYDIVTDEKRKQYEYVKEQDELYQEFILQYPRVNSQLEHVHESLKHNIEILSFKREDRIRRVQRQIGNMREKLKNIKHKFTIAQYNDSLQLKKLAVKSSDVLKDLEKVNRKGSIILETIKTCSGLEPLFFNLKSYLGQDAVLDENLNQSIPRSCGKIDKFWQQYNHVKAGNILLKEEYSILFSENRILRQKLKTYLTMFSNLPK